MFLKKLSLLAAVLVVTAALGVGGLAYRAGSQAVAADKPAPGKPPSELEALRKENELLRLNLQVVLEKVRAQEAELQQLRGKSAPKVSRQSDAEYLRSFAEYLQRVHPKPLPEGQMPPRAKSLEEFRKLFPDLRPDDWSTIPGDYGKPRKLAKAWPGAMKDVENALKALREARTVEERQRAAEQVEKALHQLKQQLQKGPRGDETPQQPSRS
jgi:hypothetical protein